MPRYEFLKPARLALLEELLAAGLPKEVIVEMRDQQCWVTCAPEEYDRVATVVAAHDAAAIDAKAASEETKKRDIESQLDVAIQQLEDARALLIAKTPTSAEVRQILSLLVRCVLGVVRLMRNRIQ